MISLKQIVDEAVLTLREPRAGAERVLKLNIPDAALWPLVGLSIILSTLVAELNSFLNPAPPGSQVIYIAPVLLAMMLGVVNITMASAISAIGRGFGGVGQFRSALILLTWQQFIWFGTLLLLAMLGLVIPVLANILSLIFVIYMIWVLIQFIAVLHGYPSFGVAAVVMILSSVAAAVAMMIMLGFLGVSVAGVAG